MGKKLDLYITEQDIPQKIIQQRKTGKEEKS